LRCTTQKDGEASFYKLFVDNNEDIIISGAFSGNNSILDLDPSSGTFELNQTSYYQQAFYAKYSLEELLRWAYTYSGDGILSYPLFIGVTSENKLVTVARYNGENDISAYGDEFVISSDIGISSGERTLIAVYDQGFLSTLEEDISNTDIKVFPNPSNSTHTLTFTVPSHTKVNVDLYDIQGRKLKNIFNRQVSDGIFQQVIDVSQLEGGIYFYRVEYDGKRQLVKFVR